MPIPLLLLAAVPLSGLAGWIGWRWFKGDPVQLDNVLSFDLGGDPMRAWAKKHDIDVALLRATIAVESGGEAMFEGRPVIRFETHIFSGRRLPKGKRAAAAERFRYGKPIWKGQAFSDGIEWHDLHTNKSMRAGQALEYEALRIAAMIDEATAYQSISMGLGQLMGFHYAKLGYSTPKAMFDDASRGANAQTRQMLRFIAADARLVTALQTRDLRTFASVYNGSGKLDTPQARKQADYYAGMIQDKLDSGTMA